MPGALQAAHDHEADELARVQAVGGGVDAAVEGGGPGGQALSQIVGREQLNGTTGLELGDHVHRRAPYPRDN